MSKEKEPELEKDKYKLIAARYEKLNQEVISLRTENRKLKAVKKYLEEFIEKHHKEKGEKNND